MNGASLGITVDRLGGQTRRTVREKRGSKKIRILAGGRTMGPSHTMSAAICTLDGEGKDAIHMMLTAAVRRKDLRGVARTWTELPQQADLTPAMWVIPSKGSLAQGKGFGGPEANGDVDESYEIVKT